MRVLLIDNSEPVRYRLREAILEIPGVAVVEDCPVPDDTRAAISKFRPDVAILELQMANGLGFEQVENLKRRFPKTILAVFTQYILPHYRTRAQEIGADYFFLKARDFQLLITTLRTLAERSRSKPV